MEHKPVTEREMKSLIVKSTDEKHPYYYRFSYSLRNRKFIAKRILKDCDSCEKRSFHTTSIDTDSALGRAINLLRKSSEMISERESYAK